MKLNILSALVFMSVSLSVSAQGIDLRQTGLSDRFGAYDETGNFWSVEDLFSELLYSTPLVVAVEGLRNDESVVVRKTVNIVSKKVEGNLLNPTVAADYYIEQQFLDSERGSPSFGQRLTTRKAIVDGGVVMASVCRCTSANGVPVTGTCSNSDCDNIENCTGNTARQCNWRASAAVQ